MRYPLKQEPPFVTKGVPCPSRHGEDVNGSWLTSKEGLVKQIHIESNYQADNDGSDKRCNAMVGQSPHEITSPREHNQWNERKWNTEAQDNLANDQGAGRIKVDSNHDQGWNHGYETTQPDGNLAMEKSLHYHLTGHGTYGGRRESRSQQ